MQDFEQSVLSLIDTEAMLQLLDSLVSIQSVNGTAAENQCQHLIADRLRRLGLEVDTWPLDFETLARHPSFCAEVERSEGTGVVGIWGRGHGRALLLNGHTDVVPTGEIERWNYDPWRATFDKSSGRVYGRGALDMKGGLCCAISAVKAIVDAGIELEGRVLIESVIGEEDGGCGTLASRVRGHGADAAVIMEPTELMIAPAQAGCFNFRVTIPGKAAHGAMRFEGIDPLEKFIHVYGAILDYERSRNRSVSHPLFQAYENPFPICCGIVRAGDWASTVAESLTFEGRYGIEPGEDPQRARAAFENVIAEIAARDPWLCEHPPVVQWWGGQFDAAEIPADHPLALTAMQAFRDVTGRRTPIRGMTYGADMRLLVNDGGIPTIMFGPGDVRLAHRPDEYVPLDDLRACTKTLALMILRFCGVST